MAVAQSETTPVFDALYQPSGHGCPSGLFEDLLAVVERTGLRFARWIYVLYLDRRDSQRAAGG